MAAFSGASSEGFDRLWEAHLLRNFGLPEVFGLDPVVWFSVINAGTLLPSFLVAEVLGHVLPTGDAAAARTLVALCALNVFGVLAFALANGFVLALGAFCLAALARRVTHPLHVAWLNGGTDPRVRATIISMGSQAHPWDKWQGDPSSAW